MSAVNANDGGGKAMNQFLSDRVLRKLETLSDERVYQVLDYIEFLESKYAEKKPAPANVFQRFAEGVEDTMRAGQVSASTVAETMNLMSKAMGVLSGVGAAGKSVVSDLVGSATSPKPAAADAKPAAADTKPADPGPASPKPDAGTKP